MDNVKDARSCLYACKFCIVKIRRISRRVANLKFSCEGHDNVWELWGSPLYLMGGSSLEGS